MMENHGGNEEIWAVVSLGNVICYIIRRIYLLIGEMLSGNKRSERRIPLKPYSGIIIFLVPMCADL